MAEYATDEDGDDADFTAAVEALRTEAAAAGDTKQVELCDLALEGDEAAADTCAQVILAAQQDAEHKAAREQGLANGTW